MDRGSSLILGIGLVLMTGVAVAFILLYFGLQVTSVNPKECSASAGTYGLRANTGGTPTKTFTGLSLAAAVAQCDAMENDCSIFSYASTGGVMSVLDSSKPLFPSQTTDTYQRTRS
jgi:hypothetical protein